MKSIMAKTLELLKHAIVNIYFVLNMVEVKSEVMLIIFLILDIL